MDGMSRKLDPGFVYNFGMSLLSSEWRHRGTSAIPKLKFLDDDEAEQAVMGEIEFDEMDDDEWLRHGASEQEARGYERCQRRLERELAEERAKRQRAETRADTIVELHNQQRQCNFDGSTSEVKWTVKKAAARLMLSESYVTRQCRAGEFDKDANGVPLPIKGAEQNTAWSPWKIRDTALKAYAERKGIWLIK